MVDHRDAAPDAPATGPAGGLSSVLDRADDLQQRTPVVAVPLAVAKKFSEDDAGKLAALISYYAFISVFPLLVVLATVLTRVLADRPELAEQVVSTAAGSFLSIGSAGGSVSPVDVSGPALVVSLLVALWSGMGVAHGMQDAANVVHEVPKTERPGFLARLGRSTTLLVIVGVGLPLTTVLQGVAGRAVGGPVAGVVAWLLAWALNTGLICLAFRRATAAVTTWRGELPGAALAALGWSVAQAVATTVLTQRMQGAEATYGSFALVVTLLFWFFTLAQVCLYCMELNLVLGRRLWPRSLRSVLRAGAETSADVRAYTAYPQREKQAHNIEVEVEVVDEPRRSRR